MGSVPGVAKYAHINTEFGSLGLRGSHRNQNATGFAVFGILFLGQVGFLEASTFLITVLFLRPWISYWFRTGALVGDRGGSREQPGDIYPLHGRETRCISDWL